MKNLFRSAVTFLLCFIAFIIAYRLIFLFVCVLQGLLNIWTTNFLKYQISNQLRGIKNHRQCPLTKQGRHTLRLCEDTRHADIKVAYACEKQASDNEVAAA